MGASEMKRLWLIFIVTIFPLTCDSTEFECEQHNISKCNSDDKKQILEYLITVITISAMY